MEKNSPKLDEIRTRFESVKSDQMLGEREKTRLYVKMMDDLEHQFGSLILYPTQDDLKREDVVLYRKISDSRYF